MINPFGIENFELKIGEIKGKRDALRAVSDSIENLALGTSVTSCGFYPPAFVPHSFNLGANSLDYFTNYLLLKYWIDKLPKLKIVLLEYEMFVPGYSFMLSNAVGLFYKSFYHYFYDFHYPNDHYEKDILKVIEAVDHQQIKPYPDENGYFQFPPTPIRSVSFRQGIIQTNVRRAVFFPPSELVHGENMAKLCKERGVDLYLVVYPHLPIYRDEARRMKYDENSPANYATKLNIPLLNFYDSAEFNVHEFRDGSHHLSQEGAVHITSLLREKILNS